MSRSLFVVLLLLLVCCTDGYAQGNVREESATSRIGETPEELFSATDSTLMMSVKYDVSYNESQKLLLPKRSSMHSKSESLRRFRGSHLVEFENGELVAIDSAIWYPWSADQSEFIEFLTRVRSDNGGGSWGETHKKWFGPYAFEYNKELWRLKPYGTFRAVFAFVESNCATVPQKDSPKFASEKGKKCTLRILKVQSLNDETERYWLSYTPLHVTFPFMSGTSTVVGFPADTTTTILRMKNYGFVFPMQFVTAGKEVISTVVVTGYEDDEWKIGRPLPDMGTYNPAVLDWEDDKLMMIAQHTSGYYRVYESTNLGKTWKESTSTLSRVWANSIPTPVIPNTEYRSPNNFITATIDGKDVILFAQSVVTGTDNELHLWLTDNRHIYHVGLIAKDIRINTSSLMFNEDKLYCLYETGEQKDKDKVLFVDLKPAMQKIKKVLKTWIEQDIMVSEGRCCNDDTCASSGPCEYSIPTTGLVGYLSGSIDGDKWNDEYLCVNAVVKGAPSKAPSSGLTFMGAGAGAIWPLSTSGLAKQYYFANYTFTIAATVTIHAVPKESIPLLGVRLKVKKVAPARRKTTGGLRNGGRKIPDPSILLGVSYNNNMTWDAQYRGEVYNTEMPQWEVGKTYSVVLTFKNGKGFAYINGTRLSVPYYSERKESEEISHFYVGAYVEDESESSTESMANVLT